MLLDTSGLLCYYHRDELQHSDAVAQFRSATSRWVHNYVLAEFIALCGCRGLPRAGAVAFVRALEASPQVAVRWVDQDLHDRALELLEARSDKSYSLCDAVSFLVMREAGLAGALTTDRHFEQEGFLRLLRD
jgi:predicted nucleic acid-binding protein